MRLEFESLINVREIKVSPLYCSNARSENDAFYPHPDEGKEGTECKMAGISKVLVGFML